MRQRADLLADVGVTAAESALFSAVSYGIRNDPDYMPCSADGPDYSLGRPVTVAECRTALTACFDKGWLRVIDDDALACITAELRSEGILGPVYGLPCVGGLDFTPDGAALWHRLLDRARGGRTSPPYPFTDVVHSKTARWFRSEAAALAAAAEEMRDGWGVVAVSRPERVGPWRAQWWRRFPEGYRIDVERRRKWEGGGEGGEGWSMSRPERWRSDPRRLMEVLDGHGVSLAAWLLFAAMEACDYSGAPEGLPSYALWRAGRAFGMTATEAECRAALAACMESGWLRVVDAQAEAEVAALLRACPALLPFSREARSGACAVDFTPDGAALYRQISEDYLGHSWEDDLDVSQEYYREEHRYCESADDFPAHVGDCASWDEPVRAVRVVSLGPWCVYWWERFPSGFRLEVEVGTP